MSSTEAAREQARQDHARNPQTEKATPQTIPDADVRNAYDAELERRRRGGQ
jgi:hypothetical protein